MVTSWVDSNDHKVNEFCEKNSIKTAGLELTNMQELVRVAIFSVGFKHLAHMIDHNNLLVKITT